MKAKFRIAKCLGALVLGVGGDILIVVDESPDTTVWSRTGDRLDPGGFARPIPWNSSITYGSLTYAGQTFGLDG